jgi:hypothetical protein
MVMKKVTIQILKLKGNKKQAKYDQKISTKNNTKNTD